MRISDWSSDVCSSDLTTAAVLWGLPLPARVLDDGIDVSVWTPRRSPRGRGVRGHQLDRRLVSAVVHPAASLVVTSPASTWALLGAVISHPYDLVAIGDAIIRTPQQIGRASCRERVCQYV